MINYSFNESLRNIPPSASLSVSEKARELKAKGVDVITLATGEPDFDTPSAAALAGITGIESGHTRYSAARGILPLRERIAKKLQEENNISCSAANILLTPGGKYAVYEAVRAFINPGKGEEVMILNPAWVSYAPIVSAAAGVPVSVELDFDNDYRIDRETLEKYVTANTKLLIINYPNNPTGRILSQEEAGAVADFLCEHNLVAISDEIYEAITFDGKKNFSPGSISKVRDRVITVNGFSKSVAMTGWRLGYVCGPEEILDTMHLLNQHTISCVSEFSQDAALASFDCEKEVRAMVEQYEHRRNFFVEGLNRIPGVHCPMPDGAFYAWARFDLGGRNSIEISEFLLERARVATVPGDAYGLGGDRCIRMSFATAEEDLRKALVRIEEAVKGDRPHESDKP